MRTFEPVMSVWASSLGKWEGRSVRRFNEEIMVNLFGSETASGKHKRHENEQADNRHHKRNRVELFKDEQDQRRVADKREQSDHHADAPCEPASRLQRR